MYKKYQCGKSEKRNETYFIAPMEALSELFLKISLKMGLRWGENFKKASAYSGTARDRISKCLASENL